MADERCDDLLDRLDRVGIGRMDSDLVVGMQLQRHEEIRQSAVDHMRNRFPGAAGRLRSARKPPDPAEILHERMLGAVPAIVRKQRPQQCAEDVCGDVPHRPREKAGVELHRRPRFGQLLCQRADRMRVARNCRIAVGAAVFQRDPVRPDVAFFENMRDGVPMARDLQGDPVVGAAIAEQHQVGDVTVAHHLRDKIRPILRGTTEIDGTLRPEHHVGA